MPIPCAWLSSILTKDGFRVRTAASVADARKLLDCESFDVLVTDIGLPDGTGYQLMCAARQSQSLRGIAISGFGMEDDVQRSMEAGFEHHLIKPIDAQQLEALLTGAKELVDYAGSAATLHRFSGRRIRWH